MLLAAQQRSGDPRWTTPSGVASFAPRHGVAPSAEMGVTGRRRGVLFPAAATVGWSTSPSLSSRPFRERDGPTRSASRSRRYALIAALAQSARSNVRPGLIGARWCKHCARMSPAACAQLPPLPERRAHPRSGGDRPPLLAWVGRLRGHANHLRTRWSELDGTSDQTSSRHATRSSWPRSAKGFNGRAATANTAPDPGAAAAGRRDEHVERVEQGRAIARGHGRDQLGELRHIALPPAVLVAVGGAGGLRRRIVGQPRQQLADQRCAIGGPGARYQLVPGDRRARAPRARHRAGSPACQAARASRSRRTSPRSGPGGRAEPGGAEVPPLIIVGASRPHRV